VADFEQLNNFINKHENIRILILDNNNIQFCSHNEDYFPVKDIYNIYDLILIPGWVYAEVSHSDKRLMYLAKLPKPLINLSEEDDYLPLIAYEDERLMKVFELASSAYPKSKKFFRGLKEIKSRTGEIPDEWIADYYEKGFDSLENDSGKVLKKNAGEISILSLSYLLIHRYSSKISQITIGSSDMGSWDIKNKILDNIDKLEVLNIPKSQVPITFKSTDVLLAEAIESKTIQSDEIITKLRPNPRSCIYVQDFPDGTSEMIMRVIDTPTFIKMMKEMGKIRLLF